MSPGYESFFGLVERPFSLTPDPKYFFKSRTHGRAIETLTFALRGRERVLLLTGEPGSGKTVLCRTLIEQLRRRMLVSSVANPLVTPEGLFRLLLEDFGAVLNQDHRHEGIAGSCTYELFDLLIGLLRGLQGTHEGAVVVIDDAHTLPAVLTEPLLSLVALEHRGEKLLQLVLAGQSLSERASSERASSERASSEWASSGRATLGLDGLDDCASTKTRLLPLNRDECAAYVAHRLSIAGAAATANFSRRAIDTLFGLSGGVPRLVNLLCERALQEAAAQDAHQIEPVMIDLASSALELLHARPRRFRWFTRKVS